MRKYVIKQQGKYYGPTACRSSVWRTQKPHAKRFDSIEKAYRYIEVGTDIANSSRPSCFVEEIEIEEIYYTIMLIDQGLDSSGHWTYKAADVHHFSSENAAKDCVLGRGRIYISSKLRQLCRIYKSNSGVSLEFKPKPSTSSETISVNVCPYCQTHMVNTPVNNYLCPGCGYRINLR